VRLEPPYEEHVHVVISALSKGENDQETLAFPANTDASVVVMREIPQLSLRGIASVDHVLRAAGYAVEAAS
jgi:hypothetical protein